MKTSEKIDTILPAIMKVKAKLQAVTKSVNNPFFKSKYADLNTHLEAVEPLLEENELMLLQPVSIGITGTNVVSSIIINKDGQYVLSEMNIVAKEADMQKFGSAITYARRYTLGALLSMRSEDDDGNAASGKESQTHKTIAKEKESIDETSSIPESKLLPPNNNRPSFRKPKVKAAPVVQQEQEDTISNGDDL